MELSSIYRFPLKSAAGASIAETSTDALGVVGDRRWMLVDPASGRFLTQRVIPTMALLEAEGLDRGGLRLRWRERGELSVEAPDSGAPRQVLIWGRQLLATDAGDEAAVWLSGALGRDCRLVRLPDGQGVQIDEDYARPGEQTAFTDGFPFMLIGDASLADLEARVGRPLGMRRFRPNLTVSGAQPYAEDGRSLIRIGDLRFRAVKPCSRCVIPTLDPDSGVRAADGEPLKTLMSYRKRDGKVYLGQNLIAEGTGRLEVGMPVEVLA